MIEVGDFIRSKSGKIRKVKTICSEEDRIKRNTFSVKKETLINGTFKISDIVNHSKNIIDLIEVGDYVNGSKVSIVDSEFIYWESGNATHYKYIETIVTKEAYASMEYKV